LNAFEVFKAKLVSLTTIMEYDIIFANITAKDFLFHFCTPFAFPFLIPHFTQKVEWFKTLTDDTQSQKALKKTRHTLSKLKLVGIISLPA
jgi:hypothetical protein